MRSEKLHLVNYIGGLLKDSEYVYFISYSGIKVADMTVLRNKLAEAGAGVHVLKNTLIKKAAELSEISALDGINFTDSTALVCGSGDASVAAKIIMEFGKTCDKVAAKGGYFEGVALTVADVDMIASLPSKEVLRAQLLGVLQAPSRNLVSLLNAKAASIINVINAYKDKKNN